MDQITVINRALAFLGERPITNPDLPETPAGKHITDQFEQCRREVLRRYPWNFAETWAKINKTTSPSFGYPDAYSLPADFLRLLIVGDPFYDERDFRIMNQGAPEYRKVIALDNGAANQLQIVYTADVNLLSLWDPLAIKVFALWLALDAAKAVTGQDNHVKLLNELLSEELKDAVGVDGQEQSIRQHRFSFVQTERDRAGGAASTWADVDFSP